MELLILSWFAVSALAAPAVPVQAGWKASGSGTDTTLSLETRAGSRSTPRKLILKCHDRKPLLGFSIGTLNESVATVRFDSEPALKVRLYARLKWGKLWMSSKDIDPDTKFFDKPAKLVTALLGHRRMLIRVTPAYGPSVEVTFDLPGLEPHLAAFEQACDLKEPIERPSVLQAGPSSPAPRSGSAKAVGAAAPEVRRVEADHHHLEDR